jgi:hypothetical protein
MGLEMNRILKAVLVLITVFSLFPLSPLVHADSRDYWSPDKMLYAHLVWIGEWKESRVEIRTSLNGLLCEKDYSSSDGQHGLVLSQGAWSPDSQFFVFSTWSSGGHQPWQSPTFFYSRQDNLIHGFSEYLSPVAYPEFSLKSPDFVTRTIWTPFTQGIIDSIELPITFKLSDLLKKRI